VAVVVLHACLFRCHSVATRSLGFSTTLGGLFREAPECHALGDCNIACTDLREVSSFTIVERSAAYYGRKELGSGFLNQFISPGSALRCLPDCPFLAVVLPKVANYGIQIIIIVLVVWYLCLLRKCARRCRRTSGYCINPFMPRCLYCEMPCQRLQWRQRTMIAPEQILPPSRRTSYGTDDR